MCDLGNTEIDTDKSPNIIDYYETEKNFFPAEYIFIGCEVREDVVS